MWIGKAGAEPMRNRWSKPKRDTRPKRAGGAVHGLTLKNDLGAEEGVHPANLAGREVDPQGSEDYSESSRRLWVGRNQAHPYARRAWLHSQPSRQASGGGGRADVTRRAGVGLGDDDVDLEGRAGRSRTAVMRAWVSDLPRWSRRCPRGSLPCWA